MVTEDGSPFTIVIRQETSASQTISLVLDNAAGELYWNLPSELIVDQIDYYQSQITFKITYAIISGTPMIVKAILRTSYGESLTYQFPDAPGGVETSLSLKFEEQYWLNTNSVVPSRGEFLKALAGIEALLIPASYSTGNHVSRYFILYDIFIFFINDIL